jgi:hypothetical protein
LKSYIGIDDQLLVIEMSGDATEWAGVNDAGGQWLKDNIWYSSMAAAEVIGQPGSWANGLNIGAARSRAQVRTLLNKLGRSELSTMSKIKPTAGPMRTQPIERASTMPTPVLPMMPTVGKVDKTAQPKQKPAMADRVRVAKAKITQRNSLRKQRDALEG